MLPLRSACATLVAAALVFAPALAAEDESTGILAAGAAAPNVVAQSVIGGKTEPFELKHALAAKAVVLYFFPAAFTSG
jgi:hypothetical protein